MKKFGLEKGIAKNQKEVVINMNKEKIDVGIICKVTGLKKEEIEKIIKEAKKI